MNYETNDTYGMYKKHSGGPGPTLMGADTLVGNDVVNSKDENIGDIKDIMLDMADGKVSYAVLSFGSFLGMGEELFAVPWKSLKLDTEHKRFVLDVNKEKLQSAPGFDKDNWPNMADKTWSKSIHSFYDTQ
jgi:sporulation protein YlmC with PRC-barrel domain